MKNFFALFCLIFANLFLLTGCENHNAKATSVCVVYGVIAVLSLIPFIYGCISAKKIGAWFVCLAADRYDL